MGALEQVQKKIEEYDERVKKLATEQYPETKVLRQVWGVGEITAVSFVLTIEDKTRFSKSREVGPYLGLRPRRNQSSERVVSNSSTKGPGAGDHQGRRLFLTKSTGGVRAEDPDGESAGHSAEAVWQADRGAGEKEGQKAGHRGSGAEAGGIAAQALGDR